MERDNRGIGGGTISKTSGISFRPFEFLELSPSTLTKCKLGSSGLYNVQFGKFVSIHTCRRAFDYELHSIMNGYISNVRGHQREFQVRVAANCTVPSPDPLRYGARDASGTWQRRPFCFVTEARSSGWAAQTVTDDRFYAYPPDFGSSRSLHRRFV